MQVKRSELIEALDICKPALATQNRAIEMGHYWFDGHQISAFNGHLTINTPFDLEISGGVPHSFLDWLDKTTSPSVTLKPEDKSLAVSAGRSRYTFPLLDPQRCIIPTPPTPSERLSLDHNFLVGLSRVIISHDPKSAVPAKMGVFFANYGVFMKLYATDDFTLSEQRIDPPEEWSFGFDDFAVVPISFIRQMFKFIPLGGKECLYLTDNAIGFTTKNATVTGNLIECPKMPNWDNIMARIDGPDIVIPEELEAALDRVSIKDAPIALSINRELLYLISMHQGARIEEEILLPSHEHETIMVKLDPKLLKRGLIGRTHMCIKDNGVRLRGPEGYTHIISVVR
jgi:DNA polymerase III sliding clamp (beta) subunit (PCNA family)